MEDEERIRRLEKAVMVLCEIVRGYGFHGIKYPTDVDPEDMAVLANFYDMARD